jgi:hypothetical protein
MQRPSYSAKAEYSVRCSFPLPSLTSRNTGSPAFAGDDGWECGALVFNESPSIQFSNSRRHSRVEPSLRAKRSNPSTAKKVWIASSLRSSQRRCPKCRNSRALATRSARGVAEASAQGGRGERRAPAHQIWTNGQVIRPGDHSQPHLALYMAPMKCQPPPPLVIPWTIAQVGDGHDPSGTLASCGKYKF